jgi:flagellar hook-associated protein 2
MSDFSIPGTASDKYGTQKLIDGLMKVERIPRDKEADAIKALETQKSVWLDFNQKLGTLRQGAQDLYNFKNPFDARIAKSSDDEVLTATATREALEQDRTILVKRAAAADRLVSSDLAKAYKVAAGDYVFTVGDKRVDLKFGGGSLQDFADALTRKGGDLLRAQVVSRKTDTRSLVIESLKTGGTNRLGFDGDAVKLALDAGLVERVSTSRQELDPAKAVKWDNPMDSAAVGAADGGLSLTAGGEAKLELNPQSKTAGMVLEIEYRMTRLPREQAPSPPPGPSLGAVGSATYEGITVTGAPSASGLPDWVPPPSPPIVEDMSMASVIGPDGSSRALPDLQDGDGTQKLSVKLDSYGNSISALGFRVKDTTRRLEVLKARIYDPTETGGFRPLNPISTAQDAVIALDGIEIARPENAISDAIPGVTLNIQSASDKRVRLRIQPDRDAVQSAIVAFVGNYNKLMAQINILTRNDEKVINEITYFTDDEKKAAKDRLGTLQGDSTLNLLGSSLQRIATSPYPTRDGPDMALLAQLGISTNASKLGSGGSFDVSKMRGYLEIEDETLAKALADHFEAAKQFFGNDTNGDLIVDSGLAYAIDSMLKPYVETGGIISLKTGTIDSQIGRDKSDLDNLDAKLADKESELKQKYGDMEASLNRMESASSSIDSFSKQNSGQ